MTRIPYTTRHRQRPPSRMGGFTLVELMITIVVAAVLMAIAVPGFQHLIISNRLTSTANEYVTALTVARSEAIKRNAKVDFNVAGDGAVAVNATGVQIRAGIKLPANILTQNSKALLGMPTGLLQDGLAAAAGYTGLVVDIFSNDLPSDNHRCVYLTTGSAVSSCTDSAACTLAAPSANCTAN